MRTISGQVRQQPQEDERRWRANPDPDPLLAMVAAARDSAGDAAALAHADAHFLGRSEALNLVDPACASIDLHLLLGDTLRAFQFGNAPGIRIGGPTALLRPEPARWIALALHELATNAIKFGALGRAGAQLDIGWRRRNGMVVFRWRERGVPILSIADARAATFGRTFIETALPEHLDAHTRFELVPGGSHCRIALPARHFTL